MRLRLLLPALLALALLPAAQAHGVLEANELEILLIEDEGSDAIEPYGGFDINAVLIGFAHDPAVGAAEAGDGFYLRADLYGLPANSLPAGQGEWTVTFTITTPKGDIQRTLTTTDGALFASDFDSLLIEVDQDERTVHVLRAFIAFASADVAPGDTLGVPLVESRLDGDLRDVAPGGIPVPGTNGLAEYPEPTAIAGRGLITETVTAQGPGIYLATPTVEATANNYTITVASALKNGGQHITLQPRATDGWTLQPSPLPSVSVIEMGVAVFTFSATPQAGASALSMDLLTDVGGRVEVTLTPAGLLDAGGVTAQAPPPPAAPAPAAGLLMGLAALGLAALARRI